MPYQKIFTAIVLALGLLILLNSPGAIPAAAQGSAQLCVNAPESVAKGDTDFIEASIDLLDDPALVPDHGDWTCAPIITTYELMGVGIAGVRISNFEIDPSSPRDSALLQPGANAFTWSINAIGDEDTSHNLLVYTYVDDPTRSSGYRSLTRIPVRIEIKEGGFLAGVARFIDTTAGRVTAIAGALTTMVGALLGLRQLIKPANKPKE
jgi:hypothetical protein